MTTITPVMYVTGKLRAHEIFLLVVSVLTGAAYIVGTPPPASLLAVLPGWQIRIWSVGMLLSGVVGIAGCLLHRNVELGLRLEQSGMLLGAGAIFLSSLAIITYAGWHGLLGTLTFSAWGLANLYRAWQIYRDLRGLTRSHS